MYLSRLIYECVKNVIYLGDEGFTYESFVAGDYDNNLDYATSINNVFTPLNKAIHRLSDRNKIKNKVVGIGMVGVNGLADISDYSKDIKKITNVFSLSSNGMYFRNEFREYGRDKIVIMNPSSSSVYYMEYMQDIKHFTRDDFFKKEIADNEYEERDIDLKEYGITDTICSYIIEFVQGHLLENIDSSLANMHRAHAEQCFDDLETQQTSFSQRVVHKAYRI